MKRRCATQAGECSGKRNPAYAPPDVVVSTIGIAAGIHSAALIVADDYALADGARRRQQEGRAADKRMDSLHVRVARISPRVLELGDAL